MEIAREKQLRALFALLRLRPDGITWNEIAAQVSDSRDAEGLLRSLVSESALVPDPRIDEALVAAEAELGEWDANGLDLVTVLDSEYPPQLREIRELPPFLFVKGSLHRQDLGMSVVGSRAASPDGIRFARQAAEALVERGLTVIGGLASGIDTAAHEAALEAGGRTVAFVGTGIRVCYPAENAVLQERIAERGLVASQFFPDAPPTKQSFPMRNATMSGYGLATIVAEAGEHSGTRIQARLAIQHGRPVVLARWVAENTEWGSALAGRPGVRVVEGLRALERVVDDIMSSRAGVDAALRSLLGDAAGDLIGA